MGRFALGLVGLGRFTVGQYLLVWHLLGQCLLGRGSALLLVASQLASRRLPLGVGAMRVNPWRFLKTRPVSVDTYSGYL